MNQMDERLKIKIRYKTADWVLEITGALILVFLWWLTISLFHDLPDSIPTHFNASGIPDDYGSRTSIFILPAIGTIIFTGITFLSRFPHIFNYPVKITKENTERQYINALRMMNFLKMAVLLIFLVIQYKTIQTSSGEADGLGIWFLPVSLGLLFIPLGIFVFIAVRDRKPRNNDPFKYE